MANRTKSKHWSEKDLKTMHKLMTEALTAGLSKSDAKKQVGDHFGVTPVAVEVRYNRWLNGMKGISKNTTKVKINRKYGKRGPYKPRATSVVPVVKVKREYTPRVVSQPVRSMTFKITNVHVDLAKGEITVNY